MSERARAEEHLRVIRSLMEKATIYRAVSAEAAAVGGTCSIAASLWLYFRWRPLPRGIEEDQFRTAFLAAWGVVLVITAIANTCSLWAAARSRGEEFISAGMRTALRAVLPSAVCALFATLYLLFWREPFMLPPIWMVCYGVGLLATGHFAPRSIEALGWAFLCAGMLAAMYLSVLSFAAGWGGGTHVPTAANLLMGCSFGFLHLVYAACTWPWRKRTADVAPES